MRIQIEDWNFIEPRHEGCIVAAELTLDNACEALIEIYPMIYANVGGEVIPEIVVLGELPGEAPDAGDHVKRWVARPPDESCEWSKVELGETFIRQVNEKIDEIFSHVE